MLWARREAPLGWVNLMLYPDSTFEFVNSGLRSADANVFPGTYLAVGDTLFLSYVDSLPKPGCDKAIRTDRFIVFDGCLGSLEIQEKVQSR